MFKHLSKSPFDYPNHYIMGARVGQTSVGETLLIG